MVSEETKQIVLAIVPKVTGFMSMVGSGSIVYNVLSDRKRRKQIYHRIMCGLSISDFFSSFMIFLSTWPIPEEKDGVYGNVGNQASCEAMGMLAQTFAIGTPFYNLSLCFYYFMVIWRTMPERSIRTFEPYLHALPITVALGTGIAGIPLTLYNPAGFLCWIAADPPGCDRDPDMTCNRGSLSWLFRWVFFYGWIWAIFLFISIAMFLIYRKVRIQEKASNKYRVRGQAKCRKRSRKVANQSMQYVCSYYMTFFFGTITRFLQLAQQGKTYFPIVVLFAIFYPLQGTFNAIIYFYSKRGREGSNLSSIALSSSLRSLMSKSFARMKSGRYDKNLRDQRATSSSAVSSDLNVHVEHLTEEQESGVAGVIVNDAGEEEVPIESTSTEEESPEKRERRRSIMFDLTVKELVNIIES